MQKNKPNHLIHETSPYLLQHAYNPVEWFAWGDVAFDKAKKEDKPILVSIGYAACHWCHVMEHESFENEETALFMNTWFVNIKVDREERPDIDNIYMNACQLLTGAGGWPLNIFLTPDLLPFSGGTYFPPKPGYGKPSWLEVLMYMKDVFTRQRDTVESQATKLSEHIRTMDAAFISTIQDEPKGDQLFTKEEIQEAVNELKTRFDTVEGGFGSAPKFPGTMSLLFLLRSQFFTHDNSVEKQIHLSLQKMMNGGIFDQVAGGFSRYTVDNKWMIPHFEKMMYDNCLLISLYAEAYMATKTEKYRIVFERCISFLEKEMMSEEYGFYSSYDADSEGVEGKYYTFTIEEINSLFKEDSDFVCRLFSVEENGNWEHTNILYRKINDEQLAAEFQLTEDELQLKIEKVQKRLFEHRNKRIKPTLDNKIILSWNALTASALVQAFKATKTEKYRNLAEKNIEFCLRVFKDKRADGTLFHTYSENTAKHPAFAEDYASFIQALLDVYEVTSHIKYLQSAELFNTYVIHNFSDDSGLFYFTHKDQIDIPIRNKDFYDNATPCANSIMVHNLLRLSIYTGNQKLYHHAEKMLAALKQNIIKQGISFSNWLSAALKIVHPYAEVAILGKDAYQFRDDLWAEYYPHILVQSNTEDGSEYPLLKHRFDAKQTQIHLCRAYVCKFPVNSVQEFKTTLQEF